MVVALSYILAVILTAAIAIVLYPISAIFWVLGLLGELSEYMFDFTQRTIKHLWKDITGSDEDKNEAAEAKSGWTCSCGTVNTGKFCSECGNTRE